MNHFKPRQRQDGKWDYTRRHDDTVWPVGYCAAYRKWTDEDAERYGIPKDYPALVLAEKYQNLHHTCGHDTPEQAQECYKRYLMDHQLQLMVKMEQPAKCDKCGHVTFLCASVGSSYFDLCSTHNTREVVEAMFKAPDESWES